MSATRPDPSEQDRIDAQASDWFARQRAGLSATEARSFAGWRSANVRHGDAIADIAQTFEDIRGLKHWAEIEPLDAMPRSRGIRMWASIRRAPRRAVLAGGAIAASIALAYIGAAQMTKASGPEMASRIAELRDIRLPDGSHVTLGAASRIRSDFSGGSRRVELLAGQAFFSVAHDAAHPFLVTAGNAVVRVVGTKFDVNRVSGSVKVAVLEGVVQVREKGALFGSSAVRTITANQRVEAATEAPLLAWETPAPGMPERVTVPAGNWRSGRLTYDGVRLADVVADINRYYGPGIRIADPLLGDRRLAASFRPSEIETFLLTLPSALPVRVERAEDGTMAIVEAKKLK